MPYLSHLTDATPTPDNPDLYYRDYGSGPETIVLVHGWPFSLDMWEHQWTSLPHEGYRVVAYDRRGFGKSGKPFGGYDYDTMARDTQRVLEALDLRDVTLVGFSMGGGEVARYLGKYNGEGRVERAVFVSSVTPYLGKSDDNPDGADRSLFEDMKAGIRADRAKFLAEWAKTFYGVGLLSHPVSDHWLDFTFGKVMEASPVATLACVDAFAKTDFRDDLESATVPCLFIHGTDDEIVPPAVSVERAVDLVAGGEKKMYDGAPHGLAVTHAERFNADLKSFISAHPGSATPVGAGANNGIAGTTIA